MGLFCDVAEKQCCGVMNQEVGLGRGRGNIQEKDFVSWVNAGGHHSNPSVSGKFCI